MLAFPPESSGPLTLKPKMTYKSRYKVWNKNSPQKHPDLTLLAKHKPT